MSKQKYTLEAIDARRDTLAEEATKQEKQIREDVESLFAPPVSETKIQSWAAQTEKALAIYDGVMLGWKIFRQFRRLIPSRSKKRRR